MQISASSTLETFLACAKQRKSTDQAVKRRVRMWRTAKMPVATEMSRRERGRVKRGGEVREETARVRARRRRRE